MPRGPRGRTFGTMILAYKISTPPRKRLLSPCSLLAATLLACGVHGSEAGNGNAVTASSIQASELVDIVAAKQQSGYGDTAVAPPFQSSTWLAALPSVSLSYLQSDERAGTDETEVSVNFPVKSPFLAARDKNLRQIGEQLQQLEQERRRLYLSGLIREALWSHKLASTRVAFSEKKVTQLASLLSRQQALFDARSASRYSLLLLQQEIADAKLLLAEQRADKRRWHARYRQLTGLGNLPADIEEMPAPVGEAWQAHPLLRMLDLDWERQRSVIAASSARAQPWQVSLHAKQVDSPAFTEDQYGVAVDVPLSFLDTAAESSTSDWRASRRSYWQQRDELQLQLAQRWQALQTEAVYLRERQSLLESAASASQELVRETRTLMGENELAREIWLRRELAHLDRQAEVAINQLRIGENRAMSRHAAGLPL